MVAPICAAVDVGSNSIHLLVGMVDEGAPSVTPLADESIQLGLGDVVDQEGHIPAQLRDATLDALELYVQRAAALGATSPILLATEPLRRASNRSVIQAEVLRATGQPLLLLSHSAEAELTFLGVSGGRPPDAPLLVVDVGGGSTELVLASPGRDPVVGSMPIGSARLTTAFVTNDPPTWFEINAMRAEALRLVELLPEPDHELLLERAVGVGGSATNLRLMDLSATTLDHAGLERSLAVLAREPTNSITQMFGVSNRRAWQLPGGAALLDAILTRYALKELEVSESSLREGAILASLRGGDLWLERLPEMLR